MKTKPEGKSGCSYGCETFADNDSKCPVCRKPEVTMVLVQNPDSAWGYRLDIYLADDDNTASSVANTGWYRTKLTALAQGITLIIGNGWAWDGRCGMVTL
jgi:hypothetical protein